MKDSATSLAAARAALEAADQAIAALPDDELSQSIRRLQSTLRRNQALLETWRAEIHRE